MFSERSLVISFEASLKTALRKATAWTRASLWLVVTQIYARAVPSGGG